MTINSGNMMYVRPSTNNMHTFTAQENSCFFDVCLPNYSHSNHLRKITYYKDTNQSSVNASLPFSDPDLLSRQPAITDLIYDTCVPTDIPGFRINELSYRGTM